MSAARQKNDQRRRGRLKPVVVLTLGLTLLLTACGRNMFDQAKVEPFEASTYFDDGAGMQVPPPNAISRERGGLDPSFLSGQGAQGMLTELPIELTLEVLQRGQERFDIYCSPCHNYDGDGRGAVVRRGFPQPPSFIHEPRLLAAPVGYFYNAITNGFGRMFSYASRIAPEDRWAISAYVKALQLSQNADPSDIPEGAEVTLPTTEAAR